MKLFVITGTCGSGKSTVIKELEKRLDTSRFICLDTDGVGLNWNDYAGTDHEYKYSDDCLKEAVRLSGGKDIVFASCLNPEDYIGKHTAPPEIDSTYFIVLSAEDDLIEQRLKARPAVRGFTSDDAIRPHIEYNRWFRKNRSKYNMFIDTTDISVDSVAEKIADFVLNCFENNTKTAKPDKSKVIENAITIRCAKYVDKAFWFTLDRHMSEAEFERKVRDRQGYVALYDDEQVGILRYNLFWDNTPFCNLLYIKEGYREIGIGKRLMTRFEDDMHEAGYEFVLTSTQSDEESQHFYRAIGYFDCGELRLPEEPVELFFRKDL